LSLSIYSDDTDSYDFDDGDSGDYDFGGSDDDGSNA
jgi:hypothetical protein